MLQSCLVQMQSRDVRRLSCSKAEKKTIYVVRSTVVLNLTETEIVSKAVDSQFKKKAKKIQFSNFL